MPEQIERARLVVGHEYLTYEDVVQGAKARNFNDFKMRIVVIDGEPWFVGKDVAAALGYVDTTNAMKQHCRGVVKHHLIADSLGRMQETRVLSEPDMLRLIVNSTLPSAERFERWVFDEGKHFMKLEGDALRAFKSDIPADSEDVSESTARLMDGLSAARDGPPRGGRTPSLNASCTWGRWFAAPCRRFSPAGTADRINCLL